MKFLSLAFLFLLSSSSFSEGIMGLHCGTRGTLLGTIASDFIIPDYFPPENLALRLFLVNPLLVDLSACEQNHPRVHLGASCMIHDRCYATLDADKNACDDDLFASWQGSCEENYSDADADTSDMCLGACTAMINIMNAALRYDDGNLCPSCRAYERSQKRTRSRLAN